MVEVCCCMTLSFGLSGRAGRPWPGVPPLLPVAYAAAGSRLLGGLAVGLSGVEELDALRDDLELLAAAVLAVPLVVVEATLDGDPPALGEVVGAHLGLAAEADDVDEVRAAVLAVLVARRGTARRSCATLGVAVLAHGDVLG